MMRMPVTVTYRDGSVKEVVASQWSIGQFAMWASKKGYTVDLGAPGAMGIVMLRYQAYAEIQRDAGVATAFEAWDKTVEDVSPDEVETVDPTQTATLDA